MSEEYIEQYREKCREMMEDLYEFLIKFMRAQPGCALTHSIRRGQAILQLLLQ